MSTRSKVSDVGAKRVSANKAEEHSERSRPEAPPEFQRRVLFGRWQAIGLALLLSVPLLALLGVLGDGEETLTASTKSGSGVAGGELRLTVTAPMCARYGNKLQMHLSVTGPQVIGGETGRVRIEIPAVYITRFTDVSAQPEIVETTERSYVVEQTLPVDGSSAPAVIDLTPERYGWAKGVLRVTDENGASVEVRLKTFIFP